MDPIIRSNRMKKRLRAKLNIPHDDNFDRYCQHVANTQKLDKKSTHYLAVDKQNILKGFNMSDETAEKAGKMIRVKDHIYFTQDHLVGEQEQRQIFL